MMILVGNKQMLIIQRQIIFTLCLLFCIHHSVSVQAQSFAQIKSLAESGNVEAQFVLGHDFEKGTDECEKDFEKAVFWYKKSIENGYKKAVPYLAMAYYNENNFTEAYPLFISFAQNPRNKKEDEYMYAASSFMVGACKLEGKGIRQDMIGAIYWFERAKNNGFAEAYHLLGDCYRYGYGVQKSPIDAFLNYKEGYEKYKKPDMAITLASCYLEGSGCTQDFSKVYSLVENIARGEIEIEESWKCKAQLSLAVAYYKDNSVSNHYEKAVKWLTNIVENSKAIEIDKAAALYWLQRCYRFGRGVAKDVNKANELVKKYSGYESDEPSLIELLEQKN
jgi:TPR repeat protein